jgi:Flp pilus assembly protein TadB
VQWGNVPAWVAALISLIFGFLSWRSSRKSKAERDEATKQAERAERAAGAAERQANAAERSATAAELQQQRETEETEAAEVDPWRLESIPGSPNCYLINTTKTAKYNVTVSGFKVRSTQFRLVGPGNREEFSVMRIWHPDDSVEVKWQGDQDLSGPPQTRVKTIPSRL